MSGAGPPYPRPVAGSNAIGSFVIGVSAIGDIAPFDVWTTVISQYANSPRLTGIITEFNEAVDLTVPLQNFYDFIWNVKTAKGYGLDVWGKIVGVERAIAIPNNTQFFGFSEGGDFFGFGQAPFFVSGTDLTDNFYLTDDAFRLLILAKAAANICDGSIVATNQILLALFPGRGNCYVTDGQDMTMTYTFEFGLSPVEFAIVRLPNLLPTPAGVVPSIVQL